MKTIQRTQAIVLGVLSLTLITSPALAHGGSHGGGGNGGGKETASAIHTDSADTMEAGRWSLSLEEELTKTDPFSDAELIDKASHHVHAHSADRISETTLGVSYGLTDDLELGLSVPYVYYDTIRAGHHSHSGGITTNSVDNFGGSYGLGDISVSGKYKVPGSWQGVSMAVIAALELPTGETGVSTGGERLDTEFQPGSGSWDKTLGVVFSKDVGKFHYDVDVSHSFAGKGSQQTDLGDVTAYNAAVSYRIGKENCHCDKGVVYPSFDLALELNGAHIEEQKVAGAVEDETGGDEIFLSPGMRYNAPQGWNAHLSVGVPVYSDMHEGEAETDYRVSTGIGFSF